MSKYMGFSFFTDQHQLHNLPQNLLVPFMGPVWFRQI